MSSQQLWAEGGAAVGGSHPGKQSHLLSYYPEPHHLELLHLQVVLHQEAVDIPNANGAVQVWLLQKQLTLLN